MRLSVIIDAPILFELVDSGEFGASLEILVVAILVDQIVAENTRRHYTSFRDA